MMRIGRSGQQLDQLLQRGDSSLVLAAFNRCASLTDQLTCRFQRALFLDRGASLLQFGRAFGPLSGPRESQAELISRGTEFGVELHGFTELRNGLRK